jgi:hypothetical protein
MVTSSHLEDVQVESLRALSCSDRLKSHLLIERAQQAIVRSFVVARHRLRGRRMRLTTIHYAQAARLCSRVSRSQRPS